MQRMKRLVRQALLGVLLAFVSIGGPSRAAAEDASKFNTDTRIYIVRPGDTLWDISDKVYHDPWKWPRIWENNPNVANPHDIYPEGELVLPHTDGKGSVSDAKVGEFEPLPATKSADVAVTDVIVDTVAPPVQPEEEPALEDGVVGPTETSEKSAMGNAVVQDGSEIIKDTQDSVAESRLDIREKPKVRGAGSQIVLRLGREGKYTAQENRLPISILGSENGRLIFGQGDRVVLSQGRRGGVEIGQKYYVYRCGERLEHPGTDEDLGVFLQTVGVLKVVEVSRRASVALIVRSFAEVETTDHLTEYKEHSQEVLPFYGDGDQTGTIVRTANAQQAVGEYQVVYADVGRRAGVEVGQLFQIVRRPAEEEDSISEEMVPLPDKFLGTGVVIEVAEKVATVLIVKSSDFITIGDVIRSAKKDS